MKKKLVYLLCISFLLASSNAFAVFGSKKGPPFAAEKPWYAVVVDWF